jgi:hypothetical protein
MVDAAVGRRHRAARAAILVAQFSLIVVRCGT